MLCRMSYTNSLYKLKSTYIFCGDWGDCPVNPFTRITGIMLEFLATLAVNYHMQARVRLLGYIRKYKSFCDTPARFNFIARLRNRKLPSPVTPYIAENGSIFQDSQTYTQPKVRRYTWCPTILIYWLQQAISWWTFGSKFPFIKLWTTYNHGVTTHKTTI